MSSSVAAQIGFEGNSFWNPQYHYDRHRPRGLMDYMSLEDWQTFVNEIDATVKPAQRFQQGGKIIAFLFMLVYVIIIVASLTVLREEKPSVIQLSILIAANILFVLFLFKTEQKLRQKAQKDLRKVLQQATTTHDNLAFHLKQQSRGKNKVFYYIEITTIMPIAVHGAWADDDDGDFTVNVESTVQSA
eukprot:scaffold9523_cov103-Cylindrotheca_fusiformis.AAC.7